MRLLVCTQKMDKNDPILGFFHRWVEEFSKHYEKVTVICLEEGEHDLPGNVKVFSLGKEKKRSRLRYIWNFYKYICQERNNYDAVFVHMNQEYVILGWKFWKLWGKKIYLWRNHAKGSLLTRFAVLVSDKVFCTSPQSYTARFKKTKLMPVGIDTDFFKPNPLVKKIPNSILFLGRIALVKNVDLFIESLNELKKKGVQFSATIAGEASPGDAQYEQKVRNMVEKYGLDSMVKFVGSVTQKGALELYRTHGVYVNLTPSGSMDKTILEAVACGTEVKVENQDLKNLEGKSTKELRDFVVENHSIVKLVTYILQEGNKKST